MHLILYPPPHLAPRILHNHCFQFSCPKRNPRQWLCKVLGSKQGSLWSMWKWWIGGVDQHLGWLSLEISVPMWFVCICGSSVGRYIGRVALYCQLSIGWASVDRSTNSWSLYIASVMYRHIFVNGCSSIGPVLVNNQHHLYNILVPKAFSFVTRYLSNDMWWTLLLITHTGCCGYQIDHELPNIGLFSCIGQHLACLCQHISHYVGLVSVECYIDWHAEQNLTKVLAVTWTKCQWKVGDLTEISQQSRDWLSTIDWSSWLPVETCLRLLT